MAGGAFDFCGTVARVAEEDEVGELVDARRRDGLFRLFGMAGLTGFPGGERSAFGGGGGFVAERALQIQFVVALVGERGFGLYREKDGTEENDFQYRLLIHLVT